MIFLLRSGRNGENGGLFHRRTDFTRWISRYASVALAGRKAAEEGIPLGLFFFERDLALVRRFSNSSGDERGQLVNPS
jgi:hypothetical protein